MKPSQFGGWMLLISVPSALGWKAGRFGLKSTVDSEGGPQPVLAAKLPADPRRIWIQSLEKTRAENWAVRFDEIETLFGKEDYLLREAATLRLLGAWIAHDLSGAAEFVAGKNNELLGSMFGQALGMVAPESTLEFLAGPWGDKLGQYFRGSVWHGMALTHPQYFLDIYPTIPNAENYDRQRTEALNRIANDDPALAMNLWSVNTKCTDALDGLVTKWLKRDEAAARQWVASNSDPEIQEKIQKAWIRALAATNPAGALAEYQAHPPVEPPEEKDYLITEILRSLAAKDPAAAVAALENLQGNHDDTLSKAVSNLPADPEAFLLEAKRLAGLALSERSKKLFGVLLNAKQENWTNEQRVEACRLLIAENAGITDLLGAIYPNDPANALKFMDGLSPDEQSAAAQAAFQKLSPKDLSMREALLQRMKPEDLAKIAARFNSGDHAAYLGSLTDPAYAPAQRAYAGKLAKDNPDAAISWVQSLANSAPAADSMVAAWAAYDDTSASLWVKTLPVGELRNGAIAGLVTGIAKSDPEAAWEWAASISDPKIAADAFQSLSKQWPNAPEAFQSALEAAVSKAPRDK